MSIFSEQTAKVNESIDSNLMQTQTPPEDPAPFDKSPKKIKTSLDFDPKINKISNDNNESTAISKSNSDYFLDNPELQSLETVYEKFTNENFTLMCENQRLKEEKNKLESFLNAYNFPMAPEEIHKNLKLDLPDLTFQRYHDIIINIDSLKNINWKIESYMSPEKKAFFFQGKKENIVIGVLGTKKVGKSFLMGKLTNLPIPEGFDDETKGLSIKYSTKDNLATVCLDSAGINSHVCYNDKLILDKLKDKIDFEEKENLRLAMINDKKLVEDFIENFILTVSNVIIVVVGILCRDDQIIIERIRKTFNAGKKIIIIHNFACLSTEKCLQDRVEKDIKLAFKVKEENIPESDLKFYIEEFETKMENKYKIWHFVYAQENTEIGYKYNKITLKCIWKVIKDLDERINFEIIQQLQKFFRLNCSKYYKLSNPKNHQLELYEEYGSIKLKNTNNIELKSKDPIFTALGSMIQSTHFDYDPPHKIIQISDYNFTCELEIPSLKENSLQVKIKRQEIGKGFFSAVKNLLKIKGEKISEGLNNDHLQIFSNRKFGKFKKILEIGDGKHVFELGEIKHLSHTGIVLIEYKIILNIKKKFQKL